MRRGADPRNGARGSGRRRLRHQTEPSGPTVILNLLAFYKHTIWTKNSRDTTYTRSAESLIRFFQLTIWMSVRFDMNIITQFCTIKNVSRFCKRTGGFKNVTISQILWVSGWSPGGDSASRLACIVRVLTADFPFISLWIRYYLLAPAYQSLFAACGLLCTGAYSLLQRQSVLLLGRGSNRARRSCFFFTIFPNNFLKVWNLFYAFLLQIEDAMLMFDKQTNRHRGKSLFFYYCSKYFLWSESIVCYVTIEIVW